MAKSRRAYPGRKERGKRNGGSGANPSDLAPALLSEANAFVAKNPRSSKFSIGKSRQQFNLSRGFACRLLAEHLGEEGIAESGDGEFTDGK